LQSKILKCKVLECTPGLPVWEELLLHINQAIVQPSENILTMRFKFGSPFSMLDLQTEKGSILVK